MVLQNFTNGYKVSNGSLLATGEKNDCSVRAIANAFDVCYDVAHAFAADVLKRKARRGAQGMYWNLVKAKNVTFDLFSDTLFFFPSLDNVSVLSVDGVVLSAASLVLPAICVSKSSWRV